MKVSVAVTAALAGLGSLVHVQASNIPAFNVEVAAVLAPAPQTAAGLASRQMTRERVVAREIGSRLAQHKRAKRSSPPGLPTICGTLPGQNFIIRVTSNNVLDGQFPSSAPGYVSSSTVGQFNNDIDYAGISTDITDADIYVLDGSSACELKGISRPGTTVRAVFESAKGGGSVTVQSTDETFDKYGYFTNFSCTVYNDVLSCILQGSDFESIFYEYDNMIDPNTGLTSSAFLATCEPDGNDSSLCDSRDVLTLTFIPV